MSEKRFKLELYENTIRVKSIKDNDEIIYPKEVVDLLNNLYEENEKLKQENNQLIKSFIRTDVDSIFKLSIFEIIEAFEYYEKRIKELEEILNERKRKYS